MDVVEFIQFGALGLIIAAIIIGWLVPGKTHDRVLQQNDSLQEENRLLRDRIEDRVIPLVQETLSALEKEQHDRLIPLVQEALGILERDQREHRSQHSFDIHPSDSISDDGG